MNGRCLWVAIASLGVMMVAAPVHAHHAAQSQFDVNKTSKVTGTITKLEMINPHPYIFVDAPDTAGKVVHWAFEAATLNYMRRTGMAKALKVGDKYTVEYFPARNGDKEGLVKALIDGQGKQVFTISLKDAQGR